MGYDSRFDCSHALPAGGAVALVRYALNGYLNLQPHASFPIVVTRLLIAFPI